MKLFIQDNEGNHNYEKEFDSYYTAELKLDEIRHNGGYWTVDRRHQRVFVPWHQVDFARIEEVEKDELEGGARG